MDDNETVIMIQELENRNKLKKLEAEARVIHLSAETKDKIGQYLEDGETYITDRELWKRQSKRCASKRFQKYLTDLKDLVIERKEDRLRIK